MGHRCSSASGEKERERERELGFTSHSGLCVESPSLCVQSFMFLYWCLCFQVFKFLKLGDTEPSMILGTKFQPGKTFGHFCQPASVAVESSGTFYVADG